MASLSRVWPRLWPTRCSLCAELPDAHDPQAIVVLTGTVRSCGITETGGFEGFLPVPYRTCSCPSRTPRLGLLRTWPQLTFTIEVTRRCPAPSFPRVTACLQKKMLPELRARRGTADVQTAPPEAGENARGLRFAVGLLPLWVWVAGTRACLVCWADAAAVLSTLFGVLCVPTPASSGLRGCARLGLRGVFLRTGPVPLHRRERASARLPARSQVGRPGLSHACDRSGPQEGGGCVRARWGWGCGRGVGPLLVGAAWPLRRPGAQRGLACSWHGALVLCLPLGGFPLSAWRLLLPSPLPHSCNPC